MNLALAIVLLWLGSALLWVATHGTTATTPWGVYRQIIDGIAGAADQGT